MNKTRVPLALAVVLAVTVATATTSFAEWQGNGGAKTGKVSSVGISTLSAGGGTITCEPKLEGEWKIRTQTKQEETSKGEHDNILVKKWGNKCLAKSSLIKAAEVKISSCEIQLEQQGGKIANTKPLPVHATLISNCTIESDGCVITFPSKSNKQLVGAVASNLTKDVSVKASSTSPVKGITDEVNGLCELAGITAVTNGTLEGEIIQEGMKLT
jgi:hypothetical protein